MYSVRRLLRYLQGAPGVKEKIELTLARLGRFRVEDSSVRNEGILKRKMILFEYVVLVYYTPVPTLILLQSS